jgi:BirA family biotin operon repressor/biotin-[acetyl-CoA-carboxylase] ligase
MSGAGAPSVPSLVFDELDSTNAEARRRAEAGERGPVWLMARRQSAGRGRRGRAWDAGQGNLTATLLTTVDKPPIEAAQLAFVAALAVADLLQAYVPLSLIGVKWPNDVLIGSGKAAGMLIESGAAPGGGLWLAIGIGVNLASHPQGVERPATSVAAHLRHDVARAPTQDEALQALSEAFQARFDGWLKRGFEPVRQAWIEAATGIGQRCFVRLASDSLSGIAEGLDKDGALLLRLDDSSLKRITAGDVFFGEA